MTDSISQDPEDNWLRAGLFNCQHCGEKFFRVDESPFDSAWRWYCDSCPHLVEIDRYEPGLPKSEGLEHFQYLDLVENHLRDCDCGRRYRRKAHPRCWSCGQILFEEYGVDVHPALSEDLYGDDAREPTEEEYAEWESWNERFKRPENLWKT